MSSVIFTSYFSLKKHPNDPNDRWVIGRQVDGRVAQNDFKYIESWYNSVNELYLEGRIFYDNLSDEFLERYTTDKIKFIKVFPSDYSNNDWRFFCYRNYLEENKFNNVFLTDGSDVTVAKDPSEIINNLSLLAKRLDEDNRSLREEIGLLNNKIGGKSVKPYQPDGLWEINNTSYKADSGDAVYRRSLYVIIKRSVPNPTLSTFDAPSRSYCIARRQRTNTPLQALVTLNDPTFVEAEKIMGEQIATASDNKKGITAVYRKLTGLIPSKSELQLLENIQSSELKKMRADINKTKG